MTPATKKMAETNPLIKMQHHALKKAWNGLPDEQRDLVKTLKIKAQKQTKSGTFTAGSWTRDTGVLTVVLHENESDLKETFNTLHHEIGHAQYNKLMNEHPEKVEKFNREIKEIGSSYSALTSYVGSYRGAYRKAIDAKEKQKKYLENWNKKHEQYPQRYSKVSEFEFEKSMAIMDHNINIAQNIYENETHSALAQLVAGTNTSDIRITDKKVLNKMFDAYKELHS